ncbi:hypothetical protein AB8O38_05900 [Saccharomonospora xinjiangensis]|uniref:hypothetical protein n=1 Tax=Saccharomonospora xinjiangensis TaxID=75294 RepID=UPI000311FF29
MAVSQRAPPHRRLCSATGVGFAILRGDWANGTVTAVNFDDEDGFNAAFAASAGSAGN